MHHIFICFKHVENFSKVTIFTLIFTHPSLNRKASSLDKWSSLCILMLTNHYFYTHHFYLKLTVGWLAFCIWKTAFMPEGAPGRMGWWEDPDVQELRGVLPVPEQDRWMWKAVVYLPTLKPVPVWRRLRKKSSSWDWNIGWYWMFSAGTTRNNFYFRIRSWWMYYKTFPSKGNFLYWKHFHECQEFLTISFWLLTVFVPFFLATCQLRCIRLPHSPVFAVNFKELWVKLIIILYKVLWWQSHCKIFLPLKIFANWKKKNGDTSSPRWGLLLQWTEAVWTLPFPVGEKGTRHVPSDGFSTELMWKASCWLTNKKHQHHLPSGQNSPARKISEELMWDLSTAVSGCCWRPLWWVSWRKDQ